MIPEMIANLPLVSSFRRMPFLKHFSIRQRLDHLEFERLLTELRNQAYTIKAFLELPDRGGFIFPQLHHEMDAALVLCSCAYSKFSSGPYRRAYNCFFRRESRSVVKQRRRRQKAIEKQRREDFQHLPSVGFHQYCTQPTKRSHKERQRDRDEKWYEEALKELPDYGRDLAIEDICDNFCFHLFHQLPIELRIMIWKATFRCMSVWLRFDIEATPLSEEEEGARRDDDEHITLNFQKSALWQYHPTRVVSRESREVFNKHYRKIQWGTDVKNGGIDGFFFNEHVDFIRIHSNDLLWPADVEESLKITMTGRAHAITQDLFPFMRELAVYTSNLTEMIEAVVNNSYLLGLFRNLRELYIYCFPQPALCRGAAFERWENDALTAEACKEAFTKYFEDQVKQGLFFHVPKVEVRLFLGYRHEKEYTRRLRGVQRLFGDGGM